MSTDATISQHPQHHHKPMLARHRAKKQQQQQKHQIEEEDSDVDMADSNASEQKKPRGGFMYFPLGYKEAAAQWWSNVSAQAAERNVLRHIPYLKEATASAADLQDAGRPDPFGHRVWRSTMVRLSGKHRALNEYSVERVGEPADETLVMLHGYGAGLGFFYKNFEPLSRVKGWKLYALDMLGMGNSSRPPFRIHAKDPQGKITEAESWFVDALEEWRKARKIEKFTLLGHSLGGYLAVSYALKYPGHLNKLILASPVGVPEDPYAVNADMPEPNDSTMANEFTQDQESIVESAQSSDSSLSKHGRKTKAQAEAKQRRPLPSWLIWLWESNFVSPFSFVRLGGPLGPRLVSGWTSRRFNHLPEQESQDLHTYSYTLFRQKGSGEFVLPYLLAPGAFARSPVINRIQNVGRGVIRPASDAAPELREAGFPVVLMYGDSDWMDVGGGYAAEQKIKERVVKALLNGTDEEKRRENGSARVIVVSKAGHHLYLDNADEFNEYMRKELEETRDYNLRQKALQQ